MKRCYSTTELAKMWDVSESTVKRWADAGVLKCRKTVGGHRKFDLDDILEFQTRSGLAAPGLVETSKAAEMDGELEQLLAGSNFAALSHRYRKAALNIKDHFTTSLLRQAYLSGLSLAAIGEQIIKPAMYEIGEMWRTGKIRVFEEHLATFATMQALDELSAIFKKKQSVGRLALVGCSDGELHQIASAVIRYLLEAEGWTVIYLGPYTPLFSFADAIDRFKPDLVCISATMADDLERASRDYEMLRRIATKSKTRIVMGGLAMMDEEVRARFRGAIYARTFQDLLDLIKSFE